MRAGQRTGRWIVVKLDETATRGISVICEMLGEDTAREFESFAQTDKFGAALSRLALQFCYADHWGTEDFTRRERSLMMIAALVALRQPSELKNHLKIGMANGVKVEEFEKILLHLVPYVGFPASSTASSAMRDFIKEQKQEG